MWHENPTGIRSHTARMAAIHRDGSRLEMQI
jgi:hypothetical protein